MINCSCYLVLLWKNLKLQLLATEILVHIQWFMQDGAKLHTANVVLDFLHEAFVDRAVSHGV
jgi:hypothetical protein